MAVDRATRAQLAGHVSDSQENISHPVLQAGSSNLGGSKRQLPEGHRHLRDEVEDLGHPQQSGSHNRQGDRESSCSSKVGQED